MAWLLTTPLGWLSWIRSCSWLHHQLQPGFWTDSSSLALPLPRLKFSPASVCCKTMKTGLGVERRRMRWKGHTGSRHPALERLSRRYHFKHCACASAVSSSSSSFEFTCSGCKEAWIVLKIWVYLHPLECGKHLHIKHENIYLQAWLAEVSTAATYVVMDGTWCFNNYIHTCLCTLLATAILTSLWNLYPPYL